VLPPVPPEVVVVEPVDWSVGWEEDPPGMTVHTVLEGMPGSAGKVVHERESAAAGAAVARAVIATHAVMAGFKQSS
jgi:hypothetical protein